MAQRRRILLLGATGSIGASTLRVVERHAERLELVGIVAHSRFDPLAEIGRKFSVPNLGLFQPPDSIDERKLPAGGRLFRGVEGVTEMAATLDTDVVLVASAGTTALKPTLAAIDAGRTIALATKEILVLAGAFVTAAARRHGVDIIPVDSEHNAIFQCLSGRAPGNSDLRRIILTASGGAFLDRSVGSLGSVTTEQALDHPNWSMGPKITVDSSTMANKGLEIIEARWLFDLKPEMIDVVIHRQSIVHSMVEFLDGSILAQLSPPSMTFAIQHALLYPGRAPGVEPTVDFTKTLTLDFEPLEAGRFPCLELAREALVRGGSAPAVFNAANEVAVAAFLEQRIGFLDIPCIISRTLEQADERPPDSLDDVLAAESGARVAAESFIPY